MSLLTQQLKRVHFEQVFVPKEGGCFIFPIANGDYNQPPGVDTKPVRKTGKILPLLVRDAESSDTLVPGPGPDEDSGAVSPPLEEVPPPIEEDGRPRTDYWTISGEYLIRWHVIPRTALFYPTDDPYCLVPPEYIDIDRVTTTDAKDLPENDVDVHNRDYWRG